MCGWDLEKGETRARKNPPLTQGSWNQIQRTESPWTSRKTEQAQSQPNFKKPCKILQNSQNSYHPVISLAIENCHRNSWCLPIIICTSWIFPYLCQNIYQRSTDRYFWELPTVPSASSYVYIYILYIYNCIHMWHNGDIIGCYLSTHPSIRAALPEPEPPTSGLGTAASKSSPGSDTETKSLGNAFRRHQRVPDLL